MSERKMRNTFREATMRNFSNYTLERYILIDDTSSDDEEKDKFVKEINERLWMAIQETNAIVGGRVLPFVIVRRVVKDNTKLRIIINDFDSAKTINDFEELKEIDIEDITHLINFKTLTPQRRVMVSDQAIPGNAKIIIDKKDQISAAVDIFLDIAMFNSVSYLATMPLKQKQEFSKLKLGFYNRIKDQNDYSCYYLIDRKESPSYFSFAFAARIDHKKIDYDNYVNIWNRFLKTEYPDCQNINVSPQEQLKFYRDRGNLDNKYFDSTFWEKYKGDYLLLRINREPRDTDHAESLANNLGINEMHVGVTKLVPTSRYFESFIRRQIDELYISAFKIVC